MDNSIEIGQLKHVLITESPILFLGAGFSSGVTTKKGMPLPLGPELKEIIIEDLLSYAHNSSEYTELASYSLSKLCQFVEYEKSREHLIDFLTEIFQGTRPAEFHYNLCKPKKCNYSTN